MVEEFIDYSAIVDEVMHIIVKKSLTIVAKSSFCGDHHFFISFLTNYPDVSISEKLKNKYPEEMTIVLQYQYEDLLVEEDFFSVTLSFDNIKERITIPYKALTAFADPSVKFGLQFRHFEEAFDEEKPKSKKEKQLKSIKKEKVLQEEVKQPSNNVIAIDSFRRK